MKSTATANRRSYRSTSFGAALADIRLGLANVQLWRTLAIQDIRLKYRRSALGPFWITLSMGITIAAMGPLYGALFNVDPSSFIPHLALGLIFWGFIAGSMTEYCEAFTSSDHFLKQSYLPLSTFALRVFYRQFLVLLHNLLLYPILLLLLPIAIDWNTLYLFPGILLVSLNVLWMGFLVAIFCTRFRDMLPIVQSLFTLLFFVTPIIWKKEQLPPARAHYATLNPLTALLDLLRDPLLGHAPTPQDWCIAALLLAIGVTITLPVVAMTRRKLTYWL